MTDVVVRHGDANVEAGVARNVELLTRVGGQPLVAASELVFATARHTFHDFRCTCVERQCGGQHHTDGLFGAVRKGDAVAHAFAVKVNTGLGGDADCVNVCGSHGADISGRSKHGILGELGPARAEVVDGGAQVMPSADFLHFGVMMAR